MKFETKKVGPDEARDLLKLNVSNRPLSHSNVRKIAGEILSGQWQNTGDTIKISTSNKLIDGQHRLHAIILSGSTIDVNFAIGVDDSSFLVIDTGKKRSSSDALALSGLQNTTLLSTTCRLIMLIKRGRLLNRAGNEFSNKDILDFANGVSELQETISFVHKKNRSFRMLATPPMSALYFLFAEISQEQADEFFLKYWSGTDLEADCPIKLLRDKLIFDSTKKSKLASVVKMVMIAQAFKLYSQGRKIKRFDCDITKFPNLTK